MAKLLIFKFKINFRAYLSKSLTFRHMSQTTILIVKQILKNDWTSLWILLYIFFYFSQLHLFIQFFFVSLKSCVLLNVHLSLKTLFTYIFLQKRKKTLYINLLVFKGLCHFFSVFVGRRLNFKSDERSRQLSAQLSSVEKTRKHQNLKKKKKKCSH